MTMFWNSCTGLHFVQTKSLKRQAAWAMLEIVAAANFAAAAAYILFDQFWQVFVLKHCCYFNGANFAVKCRKNGGSQVILRPRAFSRSAKVSIIASTAKSK